MKARRPTPEITQKVAAYVSQGAFPTTAAGAAGVDPELHREWMDRGAKPNSRACYHEYRKAVHEAFCKARVLAEIKCYDENPKTWLTKGPGRETELVEGFAREVKKSTITNTHNTVNLLADPATSAILTLLLEALQSFPEARKAVVNALGTTPKLPPKPVESLPDDKPFSSDGA